MIKKIMFIFGLILALGVNVNAIQDDDYYANNGQTGENIKIQQSEVLFSEINNAAYVNVKVLNPKYNMMDEFNMRKYGVPQYLHKYKIFLNRIYDEEKGKIYYRIVDELGKLKGEDNLLKYSLDPANLEEVNIKNISGDNIEGVITTKDIGVNPDSGNIIIDLPIIYSKELEQARFEFLKLKSDMRSWIEEFKKIEDNMMLNGLDSVDSAKYTEIENKIEGGKYQLNLLGIKLRAFGIETYSQNAYETGKYTVRKIVIKDAAESINDLIIKDVTKYKNQTMSINLNPYKHKGLKAVIKNEGNTSLLLADNIVVNMKADYAAQKLKASFADLEELKNKDYYKIVIAGELVTSPQPTTRGEAYDEVESEPFYRTIFVKKELIHGNVVNLNKKHINATISKVNAEEYGFLVNKIYEVIKVMAIFTIFLAIIGIGIKMIMFQKAPVERAQAMYSLTYVFVGAFILANVSLISIFVLKNMEEIKSKFTNLYEVEKPDGEEYDYFLASEGVEVAPITIGEKAEMEPSGIFEKSANLILDLLIDFGILIKKLVLGSDFGVDRVIFLKGIKEGKEISPYEPFSPNEWNRLLELYSVITLIATPLIFVMVAKTGFEYVIKSASPDKRAKLKSDVQRWIFVGFIMVAFPFVFREVLDFFNKLTILLPISNINMEFVDLVNTNNFVGDFIAKMMFLMVEIKIYFVFIVRKVLLAVLFGISPIMSIMWGMNAPGSTISVWISTLFQNVTIQFFYAVTFFIMLYMITISNVQYSWLYYLIWMMLITKIVSTLRQSLQSFFTHSMGFNEEALAGESINQLKRVTKLVKSTTKVASTGAKLLNRKQMMKNGLEEKERNRIREERVKQKEEKQALTNENTPISQPPATPQQSDQQQPNQQQPNQQQQDQQPPNGGAGNDGAGTDGSQPANPKETENHKNEQAELYRDYILKHVESMKVDFKRASDKEGLKKDLNIDHLKKEFGKAVTDVAAFAIAGDTTETNKDIATIAKATKSVKDSVISDPSKDNKKYKKYRKKENLSDTYKKMYSAAMKDPNVDNKMFRETFNKDVKGLKLGFEAKDDIIFEKTKK